MLKSTRSSLKRILIAWAVAPFVLLILVNGFLNVGLPIVFRTLDPAKVQVRYTYAWMIWPGWVHVRNLHIQQFSALDTWELIAEQASGNIRVMEIASDRRFHATSLRGNGLTFRYSTEGDPNLSRAKDPLTVILDDLVVTDLREIALGPVHLSGAGVVSGDLVLDRRLATSHVTVEAEDLAIRLGSDPMFAHVVGTIRLDVENLEKHPDYGSARFHDLNATAVLTADSQDLRFLDRYLGQTPWLSLTGSGIVDLDVALVHGSLTPGSRLSVDSPELVVRFLSNEVTGEAQVRFAVTGTEPNVESALTVDFLNYTIHTDAGPTPLVQGAGFRLAAHTENLGLDRPPSPVALTFDLPPSHISDFRSYNGFLPTDIGFEAMGGRGEIHGHLEASTEDQLARGDLFITGTELGATFGQVSVKSNLALNAHLEEGDLSTGRYDLSGSTGSLTQVNFVSQQAGSRLGRDRNWWTRASLAAGTATVGAEEYLNVRVELE